MTGASFEIRSDLAALRAQFQHLAIRARATKPLMEALGQWLVEVTHERFRAGRDPEGNPWAPLLPAYAAIKKGPGILRGRALRLMDSINYQATHNSVRVGSNTATDGSISAAARA